MLPWIYVLIAAFATLSGCATVKKSPLKSAFAAKRDRAFAVCQRSLSVSGVALEGYDRALGTFVEGEVELLAWSVERGVLAHFSCDEAGLGVIRVVREIDTFSTISEQIDALLAATRQRNRLVRIRTSTNVLVLQLVQATERDLEAQAEAFGLLLEGLQNPTMSGAGNSDTRVAIEIRHRVSEDLEP